MEQRLPSPMPSPEANNYRPPENFQSAEKKLPEKAPDSAIEFTGEQPGTSAIQPSAQPIAPPVVSAPMPAPASTVPIPTLDTNPLSAADDELIEKAWVDKAKKIVQETKADPYSQESEVSKLQADYIKKRYGKDIRVNNT